MIIIYLVSFYIFVSKKTFIQGIEPFSSYLFHFSNNYVYFKKLAESAIFKSGVQYLIKPFFPQRWKKKTVKLTIIKQTTLDSIQKKKVLYTRYCVPLQKKKGIFTYSRNQEETNIRTKQVKQPPPPHT